MKKMTHVGNLVGVDARTPPGITKRTSLRETQMFWVNSGGTKYRKDGGWPVGNDWPMWRLDIDSIAPIPSPPKGAEK
jgi:hypothetical protein